MKKWKIVFFVAACVSLFFTLHLQLATGDTVPEYQVVEQIVSDIGTPENRSAAIDKLSQLVNDSAQNMLLRQVAAEKLGSLGAVQAEGMLKNLAETLEWKDPYHQLKRVVTLAYWKIRVIEEPTSKAQEDLLIKLLPGLYPAADVVPTWASEELANRGVKEALPEIIKWVRYRNPGERGEKEIWLYTAKIELLSTSASRQEALSKALATDDPNPEQGLKSWAIGGLAALHTQEARMILLNFALGLQNKYYDENGKFSMPNNDLNPEAGALLNRAGGFYNRIITALKDSGMTDSEIKNTGLLPDKCFLQV